MPGKLKSPKIGDFNLDAEELQNYITSISTFAFPNVHQILPAYSPYSRNPLAQHFQGRILSDHRNNRTQNNRKQTWNQTSSGLARNGTGHRAFHPL